MLDNPLEWKTLEFWLCPLCREACHGQMFTDQVICNACVEKHMDSFIRQHNTTLSWGRENG